MWRLIFLGLIIWLIFSLLKRTLQQRNQPKDDSNDNTTLEKNPSGHKAEDMVQCSRCAIHLPRSEAFLVNGKIYCSKDHIQIS